MLRDGYISILRISMLNSINLLLGSQSKCIRGWLWTKVCLTPKLGFLFLFLMSIIFTLKECTFNREINTRFEVLIMLFPLKIDTASMSIKCLLKHQRQKRRCWFLKWVRGIWAHLWEWFRYWISWQRRGKKSYFYYVLLRENSLLWERRIFLKPHIPHKGLNFDARAISNTWARIVCSKLASCDNCGVLSHVKAVLYVTQIACCQTGLKNKNAA